MLSFFYKVSSEAGIPIVKIVRKTISNLPARDKKSRAPRSVKEARHNGKVSL